jgi:hypothetical protein
MSREEYIAQAHMVEQQTIEIRPIKTDGFILDIGGGGEGIIGKLNGMQVVAIDKRPSELRARKTRMKLNSMNRSRPFTPRLNIVYLSLFST